MRLLTQTAVKQAQTSHDLDDLLENSEVSTIEDDRKKKLMKLKLNKLPFLLRQYFQKNHIPEFRYHEFIKNMDAELLNDLIPKEPSQTVVKAKHHKKQSEMPLQFLLYSNETMRQERKMS